MDQDLATEILQLLSSQPQVSTTQAFPNASFDEIKSAVDRLASRSMVKAEQESRFVYILEPEAEQIVEHGSHEARVFEAVRKGVEGLTISEIEAQVGDKDVVKVGQGQAFKNRWIKKDKDKLIALVDSIEDSTRDNLRELKDTGKQEDGIINALKKRKLITQKKVNSYVITKGPEFALQIAKQETDITVDSIKSGSWKTASYKPYNFKALGAEQHQGSLHPLNKMKYEIRQLFFHNGFTEMPTNYFTESAFWNFEALFVGQQHPARDVQDTFYVSDPPKADRPAATSPEDKANYEEYWNNVKAVHENGKFGSIGMRYNFSEDEAQRLLLRTHTTSVSAAMLFKLAQDPKPAKYFSIDRVFRNEALDATHSCSFHQIEGVIADYGLTLGGLMAFLESFFQQLGLGEELSFKAAFNPYTEPSAEVFSYHKTLGKIIEIGNSGMFRPEMLRSMGLPEEMRVYGFGLSLERPTMIKYGIKDIRDLLGPGVKLDFVEESPAVRLDRD